MMVACGELVPVLLYLTHFQGLENLEKKKKTFSCSECEVTEHLLLLIFFFSKLLDLLEVD